VYSFCVLFIFFWSLLVLYFESSTWHEKIAPVRLPPVARLSLNKWINKLPKFDLTDGLHLNISYLSKCFYLHPNLNEAFLICPDLIEVVGLYQTLLICSNVSNFTQNLNEIFWLGQIRWRLLEFPNDSSYSRAVSILPSGGKNNDKIVSYYFAVLAIILPLIWPLFCLSWENRHYLTYTWKT